MKAYNGKNSYNWKDVRGHVIAMIGFYAPKMHTVEAVMTLRNAVNDIICETPKTYLELSVRKIKKVLNGKISHLVLTENPLERVVLVVHSENLYELWFEETELAQTTAHSYVYNHLVRAKTRAEETQDNILGYVAY